MITSHSNETVKSIRKLKDRKYRDNTTTAYVEGVRQVIEALKQGVVVEKIILAEAFLQSLHDERIESILENSSITKIVVSDEVFKSFSLKEGPKGIAAVIQQNWKTISEFNDKLSGVWVCLWEIADPGNLGTIIRTLDAAGAKGAILAGNCTDPFDPVSIRASMGAIFSKTLVKSDLAELVEVIKSKSYPVFGTSDSAGLYYRDVKYPDNMILLMGSERQGIPQELGELCSKMVSLPMKGVCDSLNLAVATGIILYEILDQHNVPIGKNLI